MEMTAMNISEKLAQPESKTLEFKRDLSSLKPILKTLVAFANTAGGLLVLPGTGMAGTWSRRTVSISSPSGY
jgi:hypothetical protein